jgi:hypothetical protein
MKRKVPVVTTLALTVTILAGCLISCSGGGGIRKNPEDRGKGKHIEG